MTATNRFLTYVTYDTTSDENSTTCPSTTKQLLLADYLVQELKQIGISDAMRDANGYVYGHIPANVENTKLPKIGLIAHMDTSPDVSGTNVKPQIILFDGTNAPMVDARYIGEKMIVSDQTTLLGADDKAGIAEIVAACDRILHDNTIKHGQISVCFTPDEEIGSGANHFDFERFDADFAYTVDGGELGEIENENFNAASAKLTVHGVNTHPGSAKNKMRNAILLLHEFMALLPPCETPAHTEGYEGFYHVNQVIGDETTAKLSMLIRDHNDKIFEERKAFVTDTIAYLNRKYGENTFVLTITDSYRNMRAIIDRYPEIIERAEIAMKKCGVSPQITAIRGGTDGARLSFEGLPCPNLSTGGLNFHSIYEAIPQAALETMTEVLVKLVSVEEA